MKIEYKAKTHDSMRLFSNKISQTIFIDEMWLKLRTIREVNSAFQLRHMSFLWFLYTSQNSKNIILDKIEPTLKLYRRQSAKAMKNVPSSYHFCPTHVITKNHKKKPLHFWVFLQEKSISVCSNWQYSTYIFLFSITLKFSTVLMNVIYLYFIQWLSSVLTYYFWFFTFEGNAE